MIAWILGNRYIAAGIAALLLLLAVFGWSKFHDHTEQNIGAAACLQKYTDAQVQQLKQQLQEATDANDKYQADLKRLSELTESYPARPVRLCWYTPAQVPGAGTNLPAASGIAPVVVGPDIDTAVKAKLLEYERYIAECRRVTRSP